MKDKMKSIENDLIQVKKAWVAPELEALDARKTYGGAGGNFAEDTIWCDFDPDNCQS